MKFLIIALLLTPPLFAEDFPGSESTNLEDEFKKGFSENQGMQSSDQKTVDTDRLKIGGSLQAEYMLYTFENVARTDYISTPMTLEIYMDSQLKDDVRVFGRGRLVHDASVDELTPSPLTGLAQKQTTSSLDELKLSFQTKHKVFWTLGKQKIKWGASKFWNPTDFINIQKRDFFRAEDSRAGTSMIKAHVPLGSSNVYLIGINDKASELAQVATAARVEIPISTSELSFTSYSRKGLPNKYGSDFSFALFDFDFYIEGAKSDQINDQSISGGATYQFKYNDEDSVALSAEGFWQENGADTTASYTNLVLSGRWVPFYVAKSYALASVYLPEPGSFNDSDYNFYFIQNTIDKSCYYRASWIYKGMSDLTWTVAIGSRSGENGTEMKILNQGLDGSLQLRAVF